MTADERLLKATKLEAQGTNYLSNHDILDSEEDLGKFWKLYAWLYCQNDYIGVLVKHLNLRIHHKYYYITTVISCRLYLCCPSNQEHGTILHGYGKLTKGNKTHYWLIDEHP